MTNILLIDNNSENLKDALLESQFNVKEITGGIKILKTFACENIDIILLNVIIPNISGWKILQEIRKTNDIPIIVITSTKDEKEMVLGLRYGADDYVIKPFAFQILLARIEAVLRRSKTHNKTNKLHTKLTKRELEVLKLISKGLNNKEIAENLILSEVTIKSHIRNLFKKLNVKNRTQAVLLYQKP